MKSLILRCDQHLPLYHPINITAHIDLAAALFEKGAEELALKFYRRARERLYLYLREQDYGCSRMHTLRGNSSEQDRSRNEEYYKLVGLDHLDMLKAFAKNMNDLLSRKIMSVISMSNPMRIIYFCFVGDSFSLLASIILREFDKHSESSSSESEKCLESDSAWATAGEHYKQALREWGKTRQVNHPDIMSTACSLARCLSELGRKREALRLLSSIIEPAKEALDGKHFNRQHTKEASTIMCSTTPYLNNVKREGCSHHDETNRVEMLAVCVWSMAVYTIEDRPNEEGRIRSMELLTEGIEILEKHGPKMIDNIKRTELLDLFKTEFRQMFEGEHVTNISGTENTNAKDRRPLSFVTV